ncbi:N-acetylneuraminate lyase isoform X2 [Columba livia]|uniref:N-acetylneuraminate lyase isoform X2 n=1 Tax=Columba livia TaxID=8932 RepID=UPI0031BB70F2
MPLQNRFEALDLAGEVGEDVVESPPMRSHRKRQLAPRFQTTSDKKEIRVIIVGDFLLGGTEGPICKLDPHHRELCSLPGAQIRDITPQPRALNRLLPTADLPDSSMTPRKKLQGLVAATITPMTPDGQVNLLVIRQYVDYLVSKQNVKSVFVNGTTGEGLSLSIQERKRLAEEWVCQGKDKLDHVIIQVGALSLPESQELARHAAAIGASGIAVIAPFFFKPTNKDELIAFLEKVASEAPAVPFYYYHIPPLTGVKIRIEELLDGIKERIPSFQGVKFSSTDLLDLAQCINKNKREQFEFLYGVDEYIQLFRRKNQSDAASLCKARPRVSTEVSVSHWGISQLCHQTRHGRLFLVTLFSLPRSAYSLVCARSHRNYVLLLFWTPA